MIRIFSIGSDNDLFFFSLDDSVVSELRRQLSAKEDLLTETRLEALAAAEQMQQLREAVASLRGELKVGGRLQKRDGGKCYLPNLREIVGKKVSPLPVPITFFLLPWCTCSYRS